MTVNQNTPNPALPATRAAAKSAGSRTYYTGKPCKNGHDAERWTVDGSCIDCRRNINRKHQQNNKESLARSSKAWREKNKDALKAKSRAYYQANKEKFAEYGKARYEQKKDAILATNKAWRKKNALKLKEYCDNYYQENKQHIKKKRLDYYYANRDREMESMRDYYFRTRDERLKVVRKYAKNNADKIKAYRDRRKDYISAVRRQWYQDNREYVLEYAKIYAQNNKDKIKERMHRWRKENPDINRAIWAARRAAKRNAMPAWADRDAIAAIYKEARLLERMDGIPRHVDHIIPLQHPLVCGLHVANNLQILTAFENMSKRNKFEVIMT